MLALRKDHNCDQQNPSARLRHVFRSRIIRTTLVPLLRDFVVGGKSTTCIHVTSQLAGGMTSCGMTSLCPLFAPSLRDRLLMLVGTKDPDREGR